MLSIRMKRLGRKGHPTYRVVVQDSRQSPSSGKCVALLGSYDPHTKQSTLVKDKAEFYLKNGAQPSDRVASLFKAEKITLPKWVEKPTKKKRSIRNPDKLRKNRPAGATEDKKPEPAEQAEESPASEAEAKTEDSKPEETKPENTEKQSEEPQAESETETDKKPEAGSDENQETSTDEAKPESGTDESSNEDKS